jgi:hypothetical protein
MPYHLIAISLLYAAAPIATIAYHLRQTRRHRTREDELRRAAQQPWFVPLLPKTDLRSKGKIDRSTAHIFCDFWDHDT